MKKLITYSLGTILGFTLLLCIFSFADSGDDLNKCLVKYKSEWSKPCSQCTDYSKSYRAYFRNDCTELLDVKVAAQEKDKRWKTFSRLNMHPNDTIVGYACNGTGKYLYWVRRTGDDAIVFPSDEEINTTFAK
ncbi:MAG: hypothetical protein IPK10_01290 [Bacteroidetes bacterium]|nr:hypothetical protein [Bacteroidota bacterium]